MLLHNIFKCTIVMLLSLASRSFRITATGNARGKAAPFAYSRVVPSFVASMSASSSTATSDNSIPNKLRNRSPVSLNNDYYVLRHGQSKANVAKVIASSPAIATKKYGLSDTGKEQAALAGDAIVQTFQSNQATKSVLLLSSDLLRAKETAEIVQQKLKRAGIPLYDTSNMDHSPYEGLVLETRLRERWFGAWDGTSDDNYPNVWKDDAVDPNHTLQNVESVNQVVQRTTECIVEWDDRVQDCFVICVAHGDVLQILQTAFAKMDGAQHRSLEHLDTATLRCIELAT